MENVVDLKAKNNLFMLLETKHSDKKNKDYPVITISLDGMPFINVFLDDAQVLVLKMAGLLA